MRSRLTCTLVFTHTRRHAHAYANTYKRMQPRRDARLHAPTHVHTHTYEGFYDAPVDEALVVSFDGFGNDGCFNVYAASTTVGISKLKEHKISVGLGCSHTDTYACMHTSTQKSMNG